MADRWSYSPSEGVQPEAGRFDDIGFGEAFLIGAGRTFRRAGAGIENAALAAGGLLGAETDERRAELAETMREEDRLFNEGIGRERPVATFLGEMAPGLATMPLSGGPITQGLVGAAEAATLYNDDVLAQLAQGAIGFGGGFLGAKVGQMTSRVMNRARAGRFTGTAETEIPDIATDVSLAVQRADETGAEALARLQARTDDIGEAIAEEAAQNIDGFHVRMVALSDEMDMRTTLGQRLNSPRLRKAEQSADSLPFLFGPLEGVKRHNYDQIANRIAEGIGVSGASDLSPQTLARAHANLEQDFADISALIGDRANLSTLRWAGENVLRNAELGYASDDGVRLARRTIDIANARTNRISGQEMMQLRSELLEWYRKAQADNDGVARRQISELIDGWDSAIADSARRRGRPQVRQAYKLARERWRLLQLVESGRSIDATGDVNVKTLYGKLQREYKTAWHTDELGDLNKKTQDALRAVRLGAYFADTVGDSGTASRVSLGLAAQSPISALAGATVSRPLGRAYTGVSGAFSSAPSAATAAQLQAGATIGGGVGRALALGAVLDSR